MKRSEFGKLATLTKRFLEDEKMQGKSEIPVSNTAKAQASAKSKNKTSRLEEYRNKIKKCVKCPLGKTRLNFVFGVGSANAKLMFVGEGPGFDEDHKGEPFVGRAGQLLTKIIESIGLKREEVYIANIVKCHPMINPSDPEKRGNDRPPTLEEAQNCLPYLMEQIKIIDPQIICALGSVAAKTLLNEETPISKLRGRFYEFGRAELMPTFHPAALLRNPSFKKDTWEDMKKIRSELKLK